MRKNNKKLNKYERTEQRKKILDHRQHGSGLYLFKNKSSVASLELPKTSKDGKKWVPPNGTWEGDSYFLNMVPDDALIVKNIETKENVVKEERLILDQPDVVTKQGKIEQTVVVDDLPLNENPQDSNKQEVEKLLTEDPLAGVTIIRD